VRNKSVNRIFHERLAQFCIENGLGEDAGRIRPESSILKYYCLTFRKRKALWSLWRVFAVIDPDWSAWEEGERKVKVRIMRNAPTLLVNALNRFFEKIGGELGVQPDIRKWKRKCMTTDSSLRKGIAIFGLIIICLSGLSFYLGETLTKLTYLAAIPLVLIGLLALLGAIAPYGYPSYGLYAYPYSKEDEE